MKHEGPGHASCSGAIMENNSGLDGGVVYIMSDASLDWQCDMINNYALVGGAM